jgi:predicted TPR repeat methyltransferase
MPRDEYSTRAYTWWHLSRVPPELSEALRRADAPRGGRALDLGCGLGTEVAALGRRGFCAAGIDLSRPALRRARGLHPR